MFSIYLSFSFNALPLHWPAMEQELHPQPQPEAPFALSLIILRTTKNTTISIIEITIASTT